METSSREFEIADATHVRVKETNLLHASDAVFWLDGASASETAAMDRIMAPLDIRFTEKPTAINFLHTQGKTAFWYKPNQPMHSGAASATERTRPAAINFSIRGNARDLSGRFNPIAFELLLGDGNGRAVVLYPAPQGVSVPAGGLVQGRVVIKATGEPLIWGVLHLEVTLGMDETLDFYGQTNAMGDFRIALTRLPPLPISVTEYSAHLGITGDLSASAITPINPSDLSELALESATEADSFSQKMSVTILPGNIQRINSVNKLFIAVQTV